MVKIGIFKIKLLHPLKHPLMHLACLIKCEFAQSDKAALLDKLRRTSSGLPTYQAKPRLSRLSCQGLSRERRTVVDHESHSEVVKSKSRWRRVNMHCCYSCW